MEKERAIELLIQAVDEIPHLKTLHYQNDEIKLWLDKVGNILRAGLKPEDYSKYWPVSQALEILKGVYEDNIYQEEHLKKITNYEIALKSILLKYEILGMEEKKDKGGEVEKMDKREAIQFLRAKLGEIPTLAELPYNNDDYPLWRNQIEDVLEDVFNRDSTEYQRFAEAHPTRPRTSSADRNAEKRWYLDEVKMREIAILSIIKKHELLGVEAEKSIKVSPEEIFRVVPPKAFIAHGKNTVALSKLTEFLETLGIEPLIVKKRASLDKDLPDKVNLYLNQVDFVVILATADDKVGDKFQPRQNVIHEIGLAQKTHPGRIIYLLEEGAEFPSNIRPRVWENFKQRNMMNAFLGIIRELRAYGMLKIIKTPLEEQTL